MLVFLRMAFRNIFRQKRRSFLTGLTIAGGFILLSVVEGIDKGSYAAVIGLFTDQHTGHVQIHHPEYAVKANINRTLPSTAESLDELRRLESVQGITRRIRGWGMAHHETKSIPVSIVGIDAEQEAQLTSLDERILRGAFLRGKTEQDLASVIIGRGVERILRVGVGDSFALISQAADGSVANDLFQVVGVLAGDDSFDRQSIYMNLADAQMFFALSGRIHEVMVRTRHPDEARRLAASIESSHEDFSEWAVRPWQSLERDFYNTMQADQKGNQVVYFIIVFMISLGVLNTIFMMIMERTREFGILKALGTRPRHIVLLIFLETAVMTSLSLIIGILASLPIHFYLSQYGIQLEYPIDLGGIPYDTITSEISRHTLLMPAAYLLAMTSLVCLIPAWRAARKGPLESMAHV